MRKKRYFWLALILTLIGLAFMIWGGLMYSEYPQKTITVHVIGLAFYIAAYFCLRKA